MAAAKIARIGLSFGIGAVGGVYGYNEYLETVLKLPNVTVVDLPGAVGNTPLIELKSLSKATQCTIYAKAEHLNPTGSVKDRAAKYLIEDALRTGKLKPGGTLIEATGGNTGVALAVFAQAYGLKTIFTMPDYIAKEKIDTMKTLGATVHVQPCVPFKNPDHFYRKAQELAETTPNSYFTDQVRVYYTCSIPPAALIL